MIGPEGVGHQVAEDQRGVACAERAGGLDEGLIAQGDHLPSDDARHGEPGDAAEEAKDDDDLKMGK
jgi:hypothetical protein